MYKLIFALWMVAYGIAWALADSTPVFAKRMRPFLIRQSQAEFGLNAPVAMFAGQINQESSWRPGITSWDSGRGLAQFMDGTARMVADQNPDLGPPAPYDPVWAITAMIRYDAWLYDRVKGRTDCQKWGATLKAYNGGLGYVKRAQRDSPDPSTWFGTTEWITSGQSAQNFEYSRLYPHKVLIHHQPIFASFGGYTVCSGELIQG